MSLRDYPREWAVIERIIKTQEDWWYKFLGAETWLTAYCAATLPIEEFVEFLHTVARKDEKQMVVYMNRAWFNGPERIHPYWGVLCDLCSESWVFYKEGPENEVE